jgi:Flp pilus assembly protein TadG
MATLKRNHKRGSAVVELALSGTLMMLVAFGAADFAAIFYDGIAVANSAGSAAFYGADDNIRAGDFTRIGQRAEDDAENDVGAVTPTVSQMCQCPGAASFDCQLYQETTCGTYGVPRAYVKVVVEEPWDSFSGLSLLPSVTVKREAYMRVR